MAINRKGNPLLQIPLLLVLGVFSIWLGFQAMDPSWHASTGTGSYSSSNPQSFRLLHDLLNVLPPLVRGWGLVGLGGVLMLMAVRVAFGFLTARR